MVQVAECSKVVSLQLGLPDAWLLSVPSTVCALLHQVSRQDLDDLASPCATDSIQEPNDGHSTTPDCCSALHLTSWNCTRGDIFATCVSAQVYLCIKGSSSGAEQIVGIAIAQHIQWARRMQLSRPLQLSCCSQSQQLPATAVKRASGQIPLRDISAFADVMQPAALHASPKQAVQSTCQTSCKVDTTADRTSGLLRAPDVKATFWPSASALASVQNSAYAADASRLAVTPPRKPLAARSSGNLRHWLRPAGVPTAQGTPVQSHPHAAQPASCTPQSAAVAALSRSSSEVGALAASTTLQDCSADATQTTGSVDRNLFSPCNVSYTGVPPLLQLPDSISPSVSAIAADPPLTLHPISWEPAAHSVQLSAVSSPATPCGLAHAQFNDTAKEDACQVTQQGAVPQQLWRCEADGQRPERAVCGVRVIWVSKASRRCGIASRLLDTIR